VINKYLAWKVENSTKVRIGSNVIVNCGERIILAEELIVALRLKGLCTLNHVANMEVSTIWAHNWFTTLNLTLEDTWSQDWFRFTYELQREHIYLSYIYDELAWVYHQYGGQYSTKLGYIC